jgi:hypothetical protein
MNNANYVSVVNINIDTMYHLLNLILIISTKNSYAFRNYITSGNWGMPWKPCVCKVSVQEYFCFQHHWIFWALAKTLGIWSNIWWMFIMNCTTKAGQWLQNVHPDKLHAHTVTVVLKVWYSMDMQILRYTTVTRYLFSQNFLNHGCVHAFSFTHEYEITPNVEWKYQSGRILSYNMYVGNFFMVFSLDQEFWMQYPGCIGLRHLISMTYISGSTFGRFLAGFFTLSFPTPHLWQRFCECE